MGYGEQTVRAYRQGGASAAAQQLARVACVPFLNAARYGQEYSYELRYGIQIRTTFRYPKPADDEQVEYLPVTPTQFSMSIRLLPIDPSTYTFVDLGCGKGFALFLAARARFRRVIGVEIDSDFLGVATENRKRLEGRDRRLSERIELVAGDAREYDFPEDPLVVFLFNPFGEQTLRNVITRLNDSLRSAPRPAYLIYLNPRFDEVVKSNHFELIGTARRRTLSSRLWPEAANCFAYRYRPDESNDSGPRGD